MPLSSHESVVATIFQELWKSHNALIQVPFMARLTLVRNGATCKLGQLPEACNVVIGPGH